MASAMEHKPERSFKIKLGKIEVHHGCHPPKPVFQNVSKKKNPNRYYSQVNYGQKPNEGQVAFIMYVPEPELLITTKCWRLMVHRISDSLREGSQCVFWKSEDKYFDLVDKNP